MTRLAAIFLLSSFVSLGHAAQNPPPPINVYVAELVDDPKESPDLVRDIEREIDTLLATSHRYFVLDRMDEGRRRLELRNEAEVTGNAAVLRQLNQLRADAVLFGQIHHDLRSGQYVFYLKLVRLNGKEEWARESTLSKDSLMTTTAEEKHWKRL